MAVVGMHHYRYSRYEYTVSRDEYKDWMIVKAVGVDYQRWTE